MPNLKPEPSRQFSKMTVAQRDHVLLELGKSLHYLSLVYRAVEAPYWKKMEKLGNRIDREHEKLAADYSDRSARIVYQALDLLAEMEDEFSDTRH